MLQVTSQRTTCGIQLSFYQVGSRDRNLGSKSAEPSHQSSFKSQSKLQFLTIQTSDKGPR